MLWPAYSDCLFAIVQAVVLTVNQSDNQVNPANPSYSSVLSETLLQHWLYSGMAATLSSNANPNMMNAETCNQIISILLKLAHQGSKSRPKAKMLLTDFAKIKKGEMGVDALVSYVLP
jgi:hypothetical protein